MRAGHGVGEALPPSHPPFHSSPKRVANLYGQRAEASAVPRDARAQHAHGGDEGRREWVLLNKGGRGGGRRGAGYGGEGAQQARGRVRVAWLGGDMRNKSEEGREGCGAHGGRAVQGKTLRGSIRGGRMDERLVGGEGGRARGTSHVRARESMDCLAMCANAKMMEKSHPGAVLPSAWLARPNMRSASEASSHYPD